MGNGEGKEREKRRKNCMKDEVNVIKKRVKNSKRKMKVMRRKNILTPLKAA